MLQASALWVSWSKLESQKPPWEPLPFFLTPSSGNFLLLHWTELGEFWNLVPSYQADSVRFHYEAVTWPCWWMSCLSLWGTHGVTSHESTQKSNALEDLRHGMVRPGLMPSTNNTVLWNRFSCLYLRQHTAAFYRAMVTLQTVVIDSILSQAGCQFIYSRGGWEVFPDQHHFWVVLCPIVFPFL